MTHTLSEVIGVSVAVIAGVQLVAFILGRVGR